MNDEMNHAAAGPTQNQPEVARKKSSWKFVWRRFRSLLSATGIFNPDEWPVKKFLRSGVALFLLVFILSISRHGVAHVRENEVGVLADNLRGDLVLKERIGYHLYFPYLANFYVLDKTIQKLSLTWEQGPGGGQARDVKLKTADGNTVSLDLIINFKLIPQKAVEVLRRSGPGLRFAETWVEPFARHFGFEAFGRLKTEEVYDATKRNEMAQAVLNRMNERLGPQGVEVIAVIPGEFRFYKEYEQVIQEKKLADQQVEEQQAQARAAVEDQARQIIEAQKKAESRLAAFEGDRTNRVIQAKAEANKVRLEADGQSRSTVLAADAAFYSAAQQATGRKATMLAEAEGMEQLRKAMGGDGGVGLVGLEYAKRMNSIRFVGTAITKQPTIQQFSVQPSEAAATVSPGGAK